MALKSWETVGSTSSSLWTWKQVVIEESTSTNDNTSNMTVVSYLGRSSSTTSSYFGGIATVSITCNGSTSSASKTFTYPTNVAAGGWVEVHRATFTVGHDNDGSKTVYVSSSLSTSEFTPNSASAGGSYQLTTIPRASGIACSSPNIGDTAIITIDKKSTSFTNTVTYTIGTISGTIATKTSSTVLSLVTSDIANQVYAQIPNARQIQGTVYCTTYNGNTQIGSVQSATFNLYAKESDCKPTITATVVDTNESTIAITSDNSKLIKYVSKPKVTITATANKSSTISSYSINLNDGQTSNLQEDTFSSIGSSSITVNATDSRSYDNPTTIDLTDNLIDYIKLILKTIDLQRPEGTSNEVILNATGQWFNSSFNDSNTNSLTVKMQYRKSGDSEWSTEQELIPTISDNTFTFTDYSLDSIYDYQEEYQFKIIINDLLMTIGSLDTDIITVPKGQEVIAIGDDEVYVYGDMYLNDISCYANNFSTSETIIGTWIDGKPIYRKVLSYDSLSAEEVGSISLADLSIDILINLYGFENSSRYQNVPIVFYNQNLYNFVYVENNVVYFKVGWDATDVYIIVEYTKTTDVIETTNTSEEES